MNCLVRATERKMSVWRMETSDDPGSKSCRVNMTQPRPQGFFLKKWLEREKALALAGHVSPRTS